MTSRSMNRWLVAATCASLVPASARGDALTPPWFDPNDVPVATDSAFIIPRRGDVFIYESPEHRAARRGLSTLNASLPVYAAIRGAGLRNNGCDGRWLEVGPFAWVCSDGVEWTNTRPSAAEKLDALGLPYRFFFAGAQGAAIYARPSVAWEASPQRELDPGWSVAVVDEQVVRGERWGRTANGQWVLLRDLYPARPSPFHGVQIQGDPAAVGWIRSDVAAVFAGPKRTKTKENLLRFDRIEMLEEAKASSGAWLRIGDDRWLRSKDVARSHPVSRPKEVQGSRERWVDIDLQEQVLLAYEGDTPIFATLVSTGRGTPGNVTPKGVFRIWVKLAVSTMDNIEREDVGRHYSMEDVPYVQFFAKDVALHAAYWHRDFGRKHSHGCVNLTPLDSKWLFDFTRPKLPREWKAVYPTASDPSTIVRVR